MNSKKQLTYTENLFRPIFEMNTFVWWLAGACATPFLTNFYSGQAALEIGKFLALFMFVVAFYYLYLSYPLLTRQLRLTTNKKKFVTTKDLRKRNQLEIRHSDSPAKRKKDKRRTYIGDGFQWGTEHANRAYQVMDMDTDKSQVSIPFLLKPIVAARSKETESLGGQPWIHGMGDEKAQMIHEQNWYGHTCITGNVGTGKTTLLRLMSLNALHMGNMLLVLDPKNDRDWQESIKQELAYLGKGDRFFHLHPSLASRSCRIPLLKNYTRMTEIADRISPLVGSDAKSKPFQDFAYDVIYATTLGLNYLGEPIRLTSISQVIKSDRRGLCYRVLDKFYRDVEGEEYYSKLADEFADLSGDKLEGMAQYYINNLQKTHEGEASGKAVDAMITFSLHDEAHYSRMIATLKPVFTALTADPLDDLFSPVHEKNMDDPRPIVDIAEIMEQGGCLYISLDSLTDGKSASFISRLILAEAAAVAGDRYNQNDQNPMRCTIANDEVHASIENNDALLNMLAQGRAAAMQMILATQTISDIESKTDKATANRFLGLCNNFISMRSTDPATQEYISTQFAKASVSSQEIRTGTSRDTNTSTLQFSTGYQETLKKTKEESFPPSLLGDLPILQYIARLSDGKKLKMRLPIIVNNDEDGETAPWIR